MKKLTKENTRHLKRAEKRNAVNTTNTQTEIKHTPLPWKTVDGMIQSEKINIWGNWCICEMPKRDEMPEARRECEANVAFIVKCVNSHDALVEALRKAHQQLVGDAAWLQSANQGQVALGSLKIAEEIEQILVKVSSN